MAFEPCTSCRHHEMVFPRKPSGELTGRCCRTRSYKSGRKIAPDINGFNPDVERDRVLEPQRATNDKCGTSGVHWDARP